jgi:DNA-binding CsgD family transcriptional regulator
LSEGQSITVVVGPFEPLARGEVAELERIVARHLPAVGARGREVEYEVLVRLKVSQRGLGAAVAQDPGHTRGAMLLAARETSRVAGGVDVLTAVRRVRHGVPMVTTTRDHEVARVLPGEKPLTRREATVLRALSEGRTNPEIADALRIATSTVHSHVRKIFRKLGVHNRRDLLGISVSDRGN